MRQREVAWRATRAVSERLVELLDPQPGEIVVDLAAGPGDTGFLARPRLGPSGRLISSDAALEMVTAARDHGASLGLTGVEYRVLDLLDLDLGDATVDGALCRFGVMLVPDPARALGEIARVLRPGGRVALAVWAAAGDNPWISTGGRAAVELGFLPRPAPDEPGPFRLADARELSGLLEDAGLRVEALEEVPVTWRAASVDDWWAVTRDMSRLLRTLLAELDDAQVAALRERVDAALSPYATADGLVVPGLTRVALARRP